MNTNFTYKGQLFTFEITDPADYLQKFWLRGTFYEIKMLMFIEARWRERANIEKLFFIDVGACIGNHSIFFSKVIGAYVVAVEPFPQNHALIVRNAYLNDADIGVYAIAAGDVIGSVKLKLDKTGNSGMHKISEDGELNVWMGTIDGIAFDPPSATAEPVHLIKIDVEGYNKQVLNGARMTIKVWHPEIYIECQTPDELQEAEDFLFPLGYKRWETPFNATPTYFFWWDKR